MEKSMNITGFIENFEVKPLNQASFLVKWKWKNDFKNIAYFQISHAYQEMNETKTGYSSFLSRDSSSSYTVNNVHKSKIYHICLKVFMKSTSSNNESSRSLQTIINRNPLTSNSGKICKISMTTTHHTQALVSCFIGVTIALLLLGFILILCRSYKRWVKRKSILACPPGSNKDYYERHRNSETTTTPTEDCSGFDECDASCTSQMIAEGLAWSPSSSLYSQYNLSINKNKSGLQNHNSSHPSSTPRILEEDTFYDSFVEKASESSEGDKILHNRIPESVVSQKITSPLFFTASCSTLNSSNFENHNFSENYVAESITISNKHALLEDKKRYYNSDSTKSSDTNLTLQLIDEV